MNTISGLAKQAGYQAVLGDSALVKLSTDTGVPIGVLHAMSSMGGMNCEMLSKAAHDHPQEFFGTALAIEKQAGNGQLNQAMTKAYQTKDPAAMKAVSELPDKEPMTGSLKGQTTPADKGAAPKHAQVNPTKQLGQVTAAARPAPGSQSAPAAKQLGGNASPAGRVIGGKTVGQMGQAAAKIESNPMLKLMRLLRRKVVQGTSGMPGMRGMPAASRLRWTGRAAGAGAAAAGLGGLAALMRGGSDGASAAPTQASPQPAAATSPEMPAAAGAGAKPQTASLAAGVGRAASPILQWIKSNPGKAGLLGLGAGGAAYGLSKLVGGKKKEKAAGDYLGDLPRNRGELRKRAAEVIRYNSTVILNRHLTKMAAESNPTARKALGTIQATLLSGGNLSAGVARAFPKMARDKRAELARRLVKGAWDEFQKAACYPGCSKKTTSRKVFHGKPEHASNWVKENS